MQKDSQISIAYVNVTIWLYDFLNLYVRDFR